jgi:hypothetical protein
MLLGGGAAMLERFVHPLVVDTVLAGTGVNALILLLGLRRPEAASDGEKVRRGARREPDSP